MKKVQIKVTPTMVEASTVLVCSHCGCSDFFPSVNIRKLSKFHKENPTGQTVLINLPANVFCAGCKNTADPIDPTGVSDAKEEKEEKVVRPDNVKVDIKWKNKSFKRE